MIHTIYYYQIGRGDIVHYSCNSISKHIALYNPIVRQKCNTYIDIIQYKINIKQA
jgi:hypothetical protein